MESVDATLIGFMGLAENNLSALFLDPDHLGQGGGRQLVDYARQLKGPLVVDVNEQNASAIGFYQALGFEVFDRSEVDSTGRPFPLLHMRETDAAPPHRESPEAP